VHVMTTTLVNVTPGKVEMAVEVEGEVAGGGQELAAGCV
jgi:hypothetical protein